MKGQINIESISSLIVFVLISSYLYLSLSSLRSDYYRYVDEQEVYSLAVSMSELIINNMGVPPNWNDTQQLIVVGAAYSNKTNLISLDKLQKLCEDYEWLKDKLELDKFDFNITLTNLETGETVINCGKAPVRNAVRVERIVAAVNNTTMFVSKFVIQVWKLW